MKNLSLDEQIIAQKLWISQNPEARRDQLGPAGWIIAINEPYWQKESIGVLAKCGHNIIYNRGAKDVRSCILASKNLVKNKN